MLKGNFNKITKQFLAVITDRLTLRKKCPYLQFFWSAFSCIWTACREIQSISPHLVRMRENMDQKNSKFGHFSRSVTFADIILKIEHSLGIQWLSVKLKWVSARSWNMKEIYWLIYGKETFCYSLEVVPRIRFYSSILGSKYVNITRPLTFDTTFDPARPQLVNQLSNVEFAFHPRLVSKSLHLYVSFHFIYGFLKFFGIWFKKYIKNVAVILFRISRNFYRKINASLPEVKKNTSFQDKHFVATEK